MKLLYGLTIALSAFLLFSVELINTRALLPLLGGSSAVWITALAFFQITLLAGYAYAVLMARLSPRTPVLLFTQFALLALSAASLFLGTPQFLKSASAGSPQLRLFLLLATSIGLPFLVLSTTAPLLQSWYA